MHAHWYQSNTANVAILTAGAVLISVLILLGWLAFLRAKQGRAA